MDSIAMIKKLWDAWDVRAMIILSLLLQIILFVLGNRRKSMVKPWVGVVLWLAYLSADWVATAALGKLTSTCIYESAPSNFLRGLWASLLLLHLGGPDTITAYALEDNLLWMRHLLGLVIQAALAVYVIVLSWTRSWVSLLNLPLFLVGIIKYVERSWSLYSASRQDSKRLTPLFDGKILENIRENLENVTDAEKIVLAHHWFALKRQDVKNYFSTTGSIKSSAAKLIAHLQDIVHLSDNRSEDYLRSLVRRSPVGCMFEIASIELGFMFDMLYTKSVIMYTKVGCILRVIGFCCSSFVLVLFLESFSIGELSEQFWSSLDVCITGILLVGAIALEFYGLFVILSSDWSVVLKIKYNKSRLLRGIFRWSSEKKRRLDCMGQFNLLRYCMSYRKRAKATKILQMIGIEDTVLKYWHTSFTHIPSSLKESESFPLVREHRPPHFTRGERALERHHCTDEMVNDTLSMDLGATIMIWHVATEICYPDPVSTTKDESIITSKVISEYMMYLLVMKPSMVSEDSNFWFDSLSGKLKKIMKQNNVISVGNADTVYQRCADIVSAEGIDSAPYAIVLDNAVQVVKVLRSRGDRWEVMRSVWLEMMHYAAICCPHLSHLQELRQGSEILTLFWLLANYKVYLDFVD
ncbi:hypothetical protein V6N13_058456 [Hibiscus sabdariffa]|uniref:DUF4220 domain-containing protein n=1 Tax=Hibiscus sabdariffa TaxID=183260 RepID=A0ABR2GG16_9ROSI